MRYTIGARIVENDGKISDGVFGYDKYGFPCVVASDDIKCDEYRMMVFGDKNEAQDYVRYLSRLYRQEFRSRAKRHQLDISQFRFFILKVDSSKFKRVLSKTECKNTHRRQDYKSLKMFYIQR